MSLFEFLMVLVSLIVGLGIAELLSGIARIIRKKDEVKLYWVHSLFIAVIFLALLQTWWEIWGVRETPSWTFVGLMLMLGGPIGLFLISHLAFPEQLAGVDLRTFYYQSMRPVFWVGVWTVIASATFRPIALDSELLALDNASSFFLVVVLGSLASTKNSAFHSCMVVLVFAALLADILLVNMEIQ